MGLEKYKLSTFGETKRLTGIDEILPQPILFREKLYVFNESGKRIGRFSLNIDQEEGDSDTPSLMHVHISNRAFVNGKLSESIVTGTVTSKLKTLEELRYECSDVADSGKHERITFLLRETTKYYLSVTNKICDTKSRTHTTIPFVEAVGLIGECANAILMRKLAKKGYEGILCLKTFLSNGKRCRNYYVTKLSEQYVNGTKMQVLIIYRNITNHRKCNVTMTLALTRTGQIIYLFWSNSKCFLHIDPDVEVNPIHFTYGEARLPRLWHKDIQLYSMYLDRMEFQKKRMIAYTYQYEPLKRILCDFVEGLCLMRPKDTICFAIQYFTAYGHGTFQRCASKIKLSPDFFGNFEVKEEDVEEEVEEEEEDSGDNFMWPAEQSFPSQE